ncbi:MAG: DNA-protecting protein DprA [Candidatus Melainabacteria bacterium]|nr:MAG: DNA-protecting protein DprA [Candidatus Melainabacteria bacterium]
MIGNRAATPWRLPEEAEMSVIDQYENLGPSVEDLPYWLAFAWLSGPGLSSRKITRLFELFTSLKEAWRARDEELRKIPWLNEMGSERLISGRKEVEPLGLLEKIKNQNVAVLHFFHPDYPALLRQIHDPPLVLFHKGKLPLADLGKTVGVVGTRHPTVYGQRQAKQMSHDLAASGVTIISGMALGIDSIAHWGAINASGRTVAVLGCGVDYCYPPTNRLLYKSLIENEGQAVISEFFPGVRPEKWHFPARNRIISGMSEALLVIEAGEQSGALITAQMAFEQNREVFAVPGRVDNVMSYGTNGLIAKNQAHLCRNYKDIMIEKEWVSAPRGVNVPTIVELYGREREVFDLISSEPVHFDYLLEKTGMNTGELSATLTMLELAGVVARLPGDWYALEAQRATV